MQREAADASQSGMVPLFGLAGLAFLVAAFARLIF